MNIDSIRRLAPDEQQRQPNQLQLPPSFPFSTPEQLLKSQYWPVTSQHQQQQQSPEDDLAYLRAVVSAPAVTTMRAVVPLRAPTASAAAQIRDDGDDDDNQRQEENDSNRRRSREAAAATANSVVDDDPPSALRVELAAHIASMAKALHEQKQFTANYDAELFPDVLFIRSSASSSSEAQQQPQQQNSGSTTTTIVVDAGCGEAVLRGSDIFAPGILAASGEFQRGESVRVCALMSASAPAGNCGFATQSPVLCGSFLTQQFISDNTVLVAADALTVMPRSEIFKPGAGASSKSKRVEGLAITIQGSRHPPLRLLQSIAATNPTCSFPPFLQNISSMIPSPLLVALALRQRQQQQQQLQKRPLFIADCCAAPGGKSSHVLSCCALLGLTTADVKLVCIERSAKRAADLQGLIGSHHGGAISQSVKILTGDSNLAAKFGTPMHKDIVDFLNSSNSSSSAEEDSSNAAPSPVDASSAALFDAVLCDPPCTGFGLRPRLRPFSDHEAAVKASADYQRKLVSTASALLRPGGFLSYSTCTTSLEENEMNVAAIASTSSNNTSLRCLAQSELPERSQKMMKVLTERWGSCRCTAGLCPGLAPNSCVWRFGPAAAGKPAGDSVDSVGFFLALFQKV